MYNSNFFFNGTNSTSSYAANNESYNEKDVIIALVVTTAVFTTALVGILWAIYNKPYDFEYKVLANTDSEISRDIADESSPLLT